MKFIWNLLIQKIQVRKKKKRWPQICIFTFFFFLRDCEKSERHERFKKRGKDEKREVTGETHVRRERKVKRDRDK